MIAQVRHTIQQQTLAKPKEPLWVAVSGGVDSMVLLHVLCRLGHPCRVVHVDHGLRGDASAADKELVQQYCTQLGLDPRIEKVDVRSASTSSGTSIQMAARDLRYKVFAQCVQQGPEQLATAHHADDAVETFVIHLLRGMGSHGWAGIPFRRGPFIRPLLECRRSDIEAYARQHAIPFTTDPSNTDPRYLRNRVRHELLPLMEDLRPGANQVMLRNVAMARDLLALASEHSTDLLPVPSATPGTIQRWPLGALREKGAEAWLLHNWLAPKGFHPDTLQQIRAAIYKRRTGAIFLRNPWRLTVDRTDLVLEMIPEEEKEWVIPSLDAIPVDAPLSAYLEEGPVIVSAKSRNRIMVDPAMVFFPMCLRPWRNGDRMRPTGLGGSKLVSDLLTDARVPAHRKREAHVLECGGQIIWLCGYRVAEGVLASPRSTHHLVLEYGPG